MQIIISHDNTDFDALASMLAAKKLYPNANMVITDKQSAAVKQFLAIYRDSLDLVPDHLIDWSRVTELILVDVASLSRIGDCAVKLNKDDLHITVYDHHPTKEGDVMNNHGIIAAVGATITVLIEEIRQRSLSITSFEATVFGLGIYTDTGSFTYANTTARDLQAASFLMEKGMNLEIIQRFSELILKPAITARAIMTSPVKTVPPEMTIEEAGRIMFRYGHTGFPIVKDSKLLGIISRRDLDKATHHGLGHAPVKAYMSSNVISIEPNTSLEEIQTIMIKHNIGRLPVVDQGKLIGILSRTNVIEILHNQTLKEDIQQSALKDLHNNLRAKMKNQLPKDVFQLLKEIGATATNHCMPVYLIGGIVRDIILGRVNDDIDIVVEGDGIAFSKKLISDYGGEVITHEDFGTATWTHPTGLKIDITSSRLEYYDHPAALPNVEVSTLKEDLYRRDFTINAMAICLDCRKFGKLVDPFDGKTHLEEKTIKILHNLSFIEDPTRILRAVRFETRFQFSMDKQTEELALISIDKMNDLSVTRVNHELEKLFTEAHPSIAMKRLFELQFWKQFGINSCHSEQSFTHAKQLEKFYKMERPYPLQAKNPSWFTYFLIPFYYENHLDKAKRFALTKKDGKLLKEVFELKDHKWHLIKDIGELHRLLKPYSIEALLFYIVIKELSDQKFLIKYIQMRNQLPIYLTGEDLKNHGLKPGPVFSNVLLDLEIETLKKRITSKKQALEWLQQQIE
ncbi:CBS domain-containing protein [Alkalihalobacillus sp. BA299]|uniref:CBS domain-containing protein n=1 Tax=Alkalihalobacillus sp. BA299 TaxID=2815938 RepID=UPI001ADC143B|nr:CBS domain-containing protein [Alkalihalobacillus sp. BA299]